MLKFKPEISEIIIARYTLKPDERQVERAIFEAKRAEEISREFPRRNVAIRAVQNGWEIFVKRA